LKRTFILTSVIAVALAAAGLAIASGHRAKIDLRKTKAGKILVNSHGFTVYAFAKDSRNKDTCWPRPNCRTVWPAVPTTGKPIAGEGVRGSLLGSITLPNGHQQVTYAGWPLYTYIADGGPGATSYIGKSQAGGRWYALTAAGHLVKKP
jgi:predicted lipoprotein with Yx(FWY)xxD motif